VKFDRLHQGTFTSSEFVPVIGDIMPARWSFEALAVEQFKNNKYEKNFFKSNIEKSQNDWYANYLIDALKKDLWECKTYKDSIQYKEKVVDDLYKLNYYTGKLSSLAGFGLISGDRKEALTYEKFNSEVAKETGKYLDSLAGKFRYFRNRSMNSSDSVTKSIVRRIGSEGIINLKNNYYNRSLEELVLGRTTIKEKTLETNKKLIQKFEPAYMKPVSKYGRAQFFAPYKQIGIIKIDTFWFNLLILWLETLILYITLYYNLFQKIVRYFENLRFTESD
jgi:hypothetical protein